MKKNINYHKLIKVIFKENTQVVLPIELLEEWWPEFNELVDSLYDSYDAELYNEFAIQSFNYEWECQLGFTFQDDEDEKYGTIYWEIDENFNMINLDWNVD